MAGSGDGVGGCDDLSEAYMFGYVLPGEHVTGENICCALGCLLISVAPTYSNLIEEGANFSHSLDSQISCKFLYTYPLLLEKMPDEELEAAEQILLAAKRITYAPGDQILQRGCTKRNLYHLVYGSAACITASGQVENAVT